MSDSPSTSSSGAISAKPTTRRGDESLRKIYLVGETTHQFSGAKLPSIRQTLQVMFYNIRFVKLRLQDAAQLTVEACSIFWEQARIPIRRKDGNIDLLTKVYEKWRNIQRSKGKNTAASISAQEAFVEILDDLFDMST